VFRWRWLFACLGTALLAACGDANRLPSEGVTSIAPSISSGAIIYSFQGGNDGAISYSNLLPGANGEFYGTTNGGGAGPSGGAGTVFEVSASGSESVLYSFQGGSDGIAADAGLIAGKNGVLYGVTEYGGGGPLCSNGCGTAFELLPSGSGFNERVLYAFQGGSDGAAPIGNLLMGKDGVLYGTTDLGGGSNACIGAPSFTSGCGTVFKLTPSKSRYTEKILYSFTGGNDGALPADSLIADASGALYGTTQFGGGTAACAASPSGTPGCGIVFKITSSGAESILYRFQGAPNDGGNPRSALVAGKNNTLYGLTKNGGRATECGNYGCGAAFELKRSGSQYTEQLIHSFGVGARDGAYPYDQNGLYKDGKDNFYGTTLLGGKTSCSCGIAFKIGRAPKGFIEKVLYSFKGSQTGDGSNPHASLTADSTGTLYGTTAFGGSSACVPPFGGPGCGVVFKVTP
jgi:uncharacterized repeat protein (TIGR03803 family)